MRFGSICSGIEAASVAWHPLGWQTSFMSEIDPFPRAVLAHHYPETPLHGDFTTISAGDYEPIDLLVGGTPCQSFSIAGLRGGLGDGRGNLALEYCLLADRLRPRWLVWENVPGVLSSNGGRDFGSILGALVKLGYGVAYRVLDAQYVRVDRFGRAVAQRRRRVFVVGYLGDWRCSAAVLFERESLLGNLAPRREARKGTAESAARSVAIRGRDGTAQAELGEEVANAILTPSGGRAGIGVGAVMAMAHGQGQGQGHAEISFKKCPALTCNHEAPIVAHSLSADGFDASEDGTGRGTPLVAVANPLRGQPQMAHRADMDTLLVARVSSTLRAGGNQTGGDRPPGTDVDTCETLIPIAFHGAQDHDVSGDVTHPLGTNGGLEACIGFQTRDSNVDVGEISGTFGANADRASGSAPMVASAFAVRRLMPVECERLQGFPDGYTAVPYCGKPAADGPRYKALGNSMAINCMAWIGHRIQMIEELTAAPQQETHR